MNPAATLIVDQVLHKNLALLTLRVHRLGHEHASFFIDWSDQLEDGTLRIAFCRLHVAHRM